MEPLAWYKIAAPVVFVVGLAVVCVVKNLPRFRAMLLGIGLLSGYGMIQDQVSTRLCPEYFTHFHNPIPGVTDPTLMGVAWGFLGAWWGGALFGYFAGLTATIGKTPPLNVRQLVLPMALTVLAVGGAVAVTGWVVASYADQLNVEVDQYIAGPVPAERRRALMVVACYHQAAYILSIVGSIACCVWVAHARRTARRESAGSQLEPRPMD